MVISCHGNGRWCNQNCMWQNVENHLMSCVIYNNLCGSQNDLFNLGNLCPNCNQSNCSIFSCDQAALWMVQSVCLSVCLSVCPSVRPSVTPFWLCSHHPIIMKFSGVITSDKSDVHAKGQGQRSKVKVTEVTTQLNRFRTVTPVWIHIWWWDDAYNLIMLRRGALLFLAATKQLYKWYFPSVRLSVRLSVCLSHLFHHVPIIVSSWNFQELLPWSKVMSMQKVKVRGQRSRSQRSTPNLAVSGL